MPTYPLTDRPIVIDDGSASSAAIQNTGTTGAIAFPLGRQIPAGQTVTVPLWANVRTTVQAAGGAGAISVTLSGSSPAAQPGPGAVKFEPGAAASMTVTVTGGSWYSDEGLKTAVTWPQTLAATTTFYPAAASNVTIAMTVGSATQTRGMRVVNGVAETVRWDASAPADGHLTGQTSEAQTGVSAGTSTFVQPTHDNAWSGTQDFTLATVIGVTATGGLAAAQNLNDLPSKSTARTNLGLSAVATMTTSQVAADSAMLAAFDRKSFVDVRDYGVVTTTTGSGDDTAGIQAALNALGNGPGTVYLPRRALTSGFGIYWLSAPLVVKPGQNLVGDGINVVTLKALPGFSGTAMILSDTWTGGGDPNSYWHWASVQDMRIDCAGVAPIGVAIHSMGECATLRRLLILNAADSGVVLTGAAAPATVEHISVSGSANYGLKLTSHPTYSGNSGAARLTGYSGDNNLGAHIYIDGAHGVSIEGWKSESHSVGCLVAGSSSPTIFATGYFNTAQTTPDLFKIQGTASPRITSTIRTNGVTNLINDTVAGRTVPTSLATVYPLLTYGGKNLLNGPVVRSRIAQTRTGNGTVTIDASLGDIHDVTLAGNATSTTITNGTVGQEITLTFLQDATGGRTYAWPAGNYAGGAAPGNVSTANRRDTVTLVNDGTTWNEKSRTQTNSVTPITPARSGRYLTSPNVASQTSNGTQALNSLRYTPVYFDRACTVTELGIYIPTGNASAAVRLGLYADNDGQPTGSPLVDAGTIDASASGYKSITGLSQAVSAGRYWVATVSQIAAATTVGVLGISTGIAASVGYTGSDMTAWVDAASTSGALPSANPTSVGRGCLANVKVS